MKQTSRNSGVSRDGVPATFDALVREFPPRAIADDVAYDNTMAMIDRLLRLPHRNTAQAEYLETLSQLVEAYEADQPPTPGDATPIDALKALMEEYAMGSTALGELLGDRTLGGRVLRGERELSKAHIRKLADHFGVSPAVFF